MANLQFQQWADFRGGIADTGAPGTQYFSHGVDPYRKPDYLSVADSLAKDLANTDDASFDKPVYWFEEIGGDIFALDNGAAIWKKDSATGWVADGTWEHQDGNAGQGQGLLEFNGNLFWASDTTVGRITTPTGTPAFTDSWQTGLTSSEWHPMAKFLAKLFVGHGRNVASWDTTSWTAQDLILPAGVVAKSMAVIGDFLAIGSVAPAGEDSRIYLWDGTSNTFNSEIVVRATSVDALYTWNNTLWVVAGTAGNLHYFDGANLQEVAKIADVDVQSGQSVTVRPGGISHHRKRVIIAVNSLTEIGDRIMPGLWSFDAQTGGFTLAHLLSTGVMNTSGDAFSVFSDGTDLYVGGEDDNTGAAYQYFVDKSGGAKYTESAYWISPWFETNSFAKKHLRKFFINMAEFPASGNNEITVKYRLDDTTKRLNDGAEYTATGGGAAYVDIASTTGLTVGDELSVTGGPSSGDIRRIITLTATRVTVDRDFTATPVNAQTKFVVEPWVEKGTVNVTDDANATIDEMDLSGVVGTKFQFKIEIRDAETSGEEVAISEMTLSYLQKKPF